MPDNVKQIREFITSNFLFGADDRSLADGDSFLENGVIDSTGIMEIVAWLEATYGFKVGDEELLPDNLDSVDNLAAFIARKSG